MYFTVSRASVGVVGPFTPDVASEASGVPPATQSDAPSDIFSAFDPTCALGAGNNTQVLDGNGLGTLAPLTCYPGWGLGLTETLAGPPPDNDQIADFDWGAPGRGLVFPTVFSLAAGSPTLTPGMNPLLPDGAEPGDLLVTIPGLARPVSLG